MGNDLAQYEERNVISYNLLQLKKTKNPYYLFKAIGLVFSQKRHIELFYNLSHLIFYSPSAIIQKNAADIKLILADQKQFILGPYLYDKSEIVKKYANKFAVDLIPDDFLSCRTESLLELSNLLVIGEYDIFAKRILFITATHCTVSNFYYSDKKVRHIHAINSGLNNNEILITTGDTAKYLDLWMVNKLEVNFEKRLIPKLAGYTAITTIKEKLFFGSDFTNRPNYIESNNKKYFFPKEAYKMYVRKFSNYQDRYLVSVNSNLNYFGGRNTVCIFDPKIKKYIFCAYTDEIFESE